MSAAKTCAPSPASFSNAALPIPDAAPVTTAILPANRIDPFSRFLLPLSLGVKGGASTARCLPLRRRSVDWTRQVDTDRNSVGSGRGVSEREKRGGGGTVKKKI